MARTTVTVSVQRASRASDGSGGKAKTWANVYAGLSGSMRYYTEARTVQAVEPAGAAPGLATVERWLFVFEAGLGILPNDRIVCGGVNYRVLTVRAYERTLQVDAERVR